MNSIGIKKWAAGYHALEVWTFGEGDARLVGWLRDDGVRAIETNADPCFEYEPGFDELWEKHAP